MPSASSTSLFSPRRDPSENGAVARAFRDSGLCGSARQALGAGVPEKPKACQRCHVMSCHVMSCSATFRLGCLALCLCCAMLCHAAPRQLPLCQVAPSQVRSGQFGRCIMSCSAVSNRCQRPWPYIILLIFILLLVSYCRRWQPNTRTKGSDTAQMRKSLQELIRGGCRRPHQRAANSQTEDALARVERRKMDFHVLWLGV